MSEAYGEIRIGYPNETAAKRAYEAVRPDDDEFASTSLEGHTVTVRLRGTNARSLLRAADDFLACVSVAEDVMNAPPMDRPNA